KKPDVGKNYPVQTPVESDDFNTPVLGLQWQWQANPQATWLFTGNGSLRLYTQKFPDSARNLWDVPNILMQKLPAPEFTATTKMDFYPNTKNINEQAGLIMMGKSYASLSLK